MARQANDAPNKEGAKATAKLDGLVVLVDGDGDGECMWGEGAGAVAAQEAAADARSTTATMHREAKLRDGFVSAIGVGTIEGAEGRRVYGLWCVGHKDLRGFI